MRPFRAVALVVIAVAFWGGMRAEAILGEVQRRFEPMLAAAPPPSPRAGELASPDPPPPVVYDAPAPVPAPTGPRPADMMVYTYPTPGAVPGGMPDRRVAWVRRERALANGPREVDPATQPDSAPPPIVRASAPAPPTHVPAPVAENRPDMSEQAYQAATRAYAYLRVGDRKAAASAFAVALSLAPDHPRASAWAREQKRLSRWWRADVYLFQRGSDGGSLIRTPGLPAASPVLGGGMAAGLLAVTPNPLSRRPVEVFVRYAIPQNGFRQSDRLRSQGAAGVSIRPFPRIPVTLVAERLFKFGSLARNDWALRGYGGTSQARARDRPVSFFGEAGVIGKRPDTFAGVQMIAEKSVQAARQIRCRAGSSAHGARFSTADRTIDRLDLGPTLRLTHPKAPISVRVEYRARVTGNARPGSGLALTVSSVY